MRAHRLLRSIRVLPLAFAMITVLPAHADSGVGVDTWRANKLDPAAGATLNGCDDRGTSWLEPGQHRSPTGNLYACPPPSPHPDEHGDWQYYGVLQLGLLGTGGDDRNALWNRYVDWDSGLILGLLDMNFERPADGTYANVRASRLSDDDQYYQAVFGRAGSYKVQAFIRDMPNVLSNNARPIWNGVGTNTLTLPSSLVAGGSTSAEVAAVSAATPERTLSVKRSTSRASVTACISRRNGPRMRMRPTRNAKAHARSAGRSSSTIRSRPMAACWKRSSRSTMRRSIVNGGFRYAGPVWRMDFGYTGSFYRDRYTRFTYETPFALYPVVPGAVSAPLTTGQFATEPDNNYHNLQAAFTRKLPMNGELSLTASGGRMTPERHADPTD